MNYAAMFGYLEATLPEDTRREIVTALKVKDLDGHLGPIGRDTLDAIEATLPEEVDPR